MRKIEPEVYDDDGMDSLIGNKRKKRDVYPEFRVDNKFLPEAKKWEVGKEYTVKLKLKMIGKSISKFQNNTEYEIRGVEIK